jgi:O-antigen/teichoic acid export membrane protein
MVEPLRNRYFHKLGAKIINTPINIAITLIVPRFLGVAEYGNYNFLTDFFIKLMSFLDTGTSSCFFTHLSREQKNAAILRFYWGLVVTISIISVIITTLVFAFGKGGSIWVDQKVHTIWLSLIWGLLYWYHQIFYKIMDATGATVKAEFAQVKQKVIGLCILSIMAIFGHFSLVTYFLFQYMLYVIVFILWWKVLDKAGIEMFPSQNLSKTEFRKYTGIFYKFSQPMFWGGIFAIVFGFGERWLLQVYGGSQQQGLYSLAFQISALCFLFTSSLAPLFHREVSRALGENNLDEVRRLFLRFVPMLYSVSAALGIFCFFQADKITTIVGGSEYNEAIMPVAIMCLFPIHQTFGQLNSAVYFASGKTRLYRNVGIFTKILGFIVTIYFLGPKNQYCLELGSTGLAVKMVLIQFIGQNILLWFNSKYIKISFSRLVKHQFISLIIIFTIGGLVLAIADLISMNVILSLLVSAILYSFALVGTTYIYPQMFSTSRSEISHYFRVVSKIILRKRGTP